MLAVHQYTGITFSIASLIKLHSIAGTTMPVIERDVSLSSVFVKND